MRPDQPPRYAQKLFAWVAGRANVDDLLGDMDEWFHENLKSMSPRKAKLLYWKQAISLSFSYAIRKRKRDARYSSHYSSSLSIDMLSNYVKIALRNLYQYKYFSILNAFGLAIGMSISLLLIALYSFVSTYDNFHEHGDNIYAVISRQTEGVEEADYATAPAVLADKLASEFSGATKVLKLSRGYGLEVKTVKENLPARVYVTEPEFFQLFSFDMIQGNAAALSKPNQVIITESAAKRIFNEDNIVGKTFEFTSGRVVEVAGLMKDPPSNTHFNFEVLLSYSSLPQDDRNLSELWTDFQLQYVYVFVRDQSAQNELQSYLKNISADVYKDLPTKVSYRPMALKDLVTADIRQAVGVQWEASGFIFFAVFALLILLPACFNYTNISIARAMRRAKEIGLRKTMGGVRTQIFLQFITETVIITLLSLAGSLLIFLLVRSEFQSMLVAGSMLDLSLSWRMIGMFVLFALVTGLLAGLFPAMYFSKLNPIEALKSKVSNRGSSLKIRRILTVFQFALSFGFILSLVMFSKQYRHTLNFDFGFNKSNLVDIELQDVSADQVRAAYSQHKSVESISMSSGLLGVNESRTYISTNQTDSTEIAQMFVDERFISNFNIQLIAGQNFPNELWQREHYMIVNEEFLTAHKIATAADALGRTYFVEGKELQVIGVVKNFHYAPLTEPIRKFMFRNDPARFAYANLEVTSHDPYSMFSEMEAIWKQLPTEKKFLGKYFEEEFAEAYQTYTILIKVVGFLGFLAITISLLGMLGMVVYTAETKTKEVSIRKVMGASVSSITLLLSKDYLKMMAWAMAVSIPVTAFILSMLLPELQYYSVSLSVWDVLLSAVILVTLGVATISSQTYKTAMANPATTLRSE